MKFDFRTWLVQNYDIKPEMLDREGLELAKKEYAEEYPEVGEGEVRRRCHLWFEQHVVGFAACPPAHSGSGHRL